ncbi:hypothetical protein TCAL_13266 [Tigriopus californicus]|uniref:Ubiquitin carboxyl-terminal hydrolase n=1 Tax=Tigriopus californicus TaxID=6832 RepID=A0A553PBC6_TIGCA|nr:ubiquitin carboxyl-terminal hydrolase 20-like [Tigriopus californicus]TRY74991.1 hypothetical protein TCAL_13266 [Tigriopus californicus]|eukprot:TCALIF_13266-PA protein Name:"Similar to usp33 Ubiquitin carboxyl-terminal hydrolase 33 (Danio rerio)" AED:0.04 eAED:0.04 QI:123/1/1/1/1/1/6/260/892
MAATAPAPVECDCPHFASAVGFLSESEFQSLLHENPACHDCPVGQLEGSLCETDPPAMGGLWVCLYPGCLVLGCSEGVDHSSRHQDKFSRHWAQMNVLTRRIWCYACRREVHIQSVPARLGALVRPKDGATFQPRAPRLEEHAPPRRTRPRGLLGLSNLGNTCYMNSALQCLLNTPALAEFFQACPTLVHKADKGGHLSKAFMRLVGEMRDPRNRDPYLPPTQVLHAIKSAYPMFRGFQQHDAQEFLRCFMDLMHEELIEPIHQMVDVDEDNLESVSEAGSHEAEDSGPEEYETADSGVSEQSSATSSNSDNSRKRKRPTSTDTGVASYRSERLDEPCSTPPSEAELEFADAASSQSGSPPDPASRLVAMCPPRSPVRITPTIRTRRPKVYRSVITDIFDGKLISSVECLSCNKVSTTTEAFQDLSLPIPTQDTLAALRSQPVNDGWMAWAYSWMFGWYYGPNISLNDCLSYFFSADELKGDNMYSCEKCKKLRNGLKFSQVTVLPDTLCIHLKRFRHDFSYSSKISTKVSFPLVDLDMTPWLHKDATSQVTLYDLTGVICHHGSAGGGHYTAYALNPDNLDWYEFDDSRVSKVEPATVMNAEAYVLFYRKNNLTNEHMREQVVQLIQENAPSLIKFFVSKQWFNKFENFAEPGPIDNSDFLCPHGGVLPMKSEYVYDLCIELAQPVWDRLHAHFGGGPVCNLLHECSQCRMELDALTRQKKFELEEFKTLHLEFEETGQDLYYVLSSAWFRIWEGFVHNRERDPPGPIDNKAIVSMSSNRNGHPVLRSGADYIRMSHDMWRLLHSIYGGGPEIVIHAANGNVQVLTGSRKPSLPALCTRLRARSSSESSNWGSNVGVTYAPSSSGRVTRAKSKSESVSKHATRELDEEPDE